MLSVEVGGTPRDFAIETVVVAGYTGRDRNAVLHHVRELEAIGVPPPPYFPYYWRFPPWLAVSTDHVVVAGANTSGEAELVLLVEGDDVFVTLGSDHTDRSAETVDIALSKGVCPKPVAAAAWPAAEIGHRWGELVLRSWIVEEGRELLYQEGACASLVAPLELLSALPFARPRCFAMLTGTMPAIGGVRSSSRFRAELHDPGRNRSLNIGYEITSLEA